MKPRFLIIQTYYPEFLNDFYASEPGLGSLEFDAQHERVFSKGFGIGDVFSHYLRKLGCEAFEVIVNADLMQQQWAREHDLALSGNIQQAGFASHDHRRRIVEAQISHYRPDVVYVFEWCPLGDQFLAAIKKTGRTGLPGVRLLVGQIASTLPTNRTFAAYDLMLSSYPPIVDHFRSEEREADPLAGAQYIRLGFDHRILDQLGDLPDRQAGCARDIDVSFVGGFAPAHGDRVRWLEHILTRFDIAIYGYGLENIPETSPIRRVHRGPIWGFDMYRTLKRSKVTINLHAKIEVAGNVTSTHANNMRLFEATGVGTCLLTDEKADLSDIFEPDHEVLTFSSNEECVEKLGQVLGDETKRRAIARAGQERTLREHTYAHRMEELLCIVQERLRLRHAAPRSTAVY